jgi:hypothetical protein
MREIKKEVQKQKSLFKASEAAYKAQPIKDGPIARLHLSRMENARKKLGELVSVAKLNLG